MKHYLWIHSLCHDDKNSKNCTMAVDNNQSCHCESFKNMITAKKKNKKYSKSHSWKPSSGVRVPSLVLFATENDWQDTDFLKGSFGDLLLDNFNCFPSIEKVGLNSGFSL